MRNKQAEFSKLDAIEIEARKAWADHVVACPDCARSPLACVEGLRLGEVSNSAWREARKSYLELKEWI